MEVFSLSGIEEGLFGVKFSPFGGYIISYGSDEMCIWDFATRKMVKKLRMTNDSILFNNLDENENDFIVAQKYSKQFHKIGLPQGDILQSSEKIHENYLSGLAQSSDGTLIATSGVTFVFAATAGSDSLTSARNAPTICKCVSALGLKVVLKLRSNASAFRGGTEGGFTKPTKASLKTSSLILTGP